MPPKKCQDCGKSFEPLNSGFRKCKACHEVDSLKLKAPPKATALPTAITSPAPKASPPTAQQCNRTREEFDGLLEKYNAHLPDDGTPTPKATIIFQQTFIEGSEKKPKCNVCNKFIAEHPNQPVPVVAPVNLSEVDGIMKFGMQRKYPLHKFFNPCSDKTEQIPPEAKPEMRELMGNCCCVCGRTKVSIAHLLKHPNICKKAKVRWDYREDLSNFLLLCGSDGEKGACHDAFDKFQMSFQHVEGCDRSQWQVIGGRHHGRQVTIPSKPHRRVVHAHLAHCVVNDTLAEITDFRTRPDLSESPEDVRGIEEEE
jgi:hypothetical protein